MFPGLIKLLPTNCSYAVKKWSPFLSEIDSRFKELSENFDDHVIVYEHLLSFIYEKYGHDVLTFIGILMSAIKDVDKQRQLHKFKSSKCTMYV